jgi:hypothetical protein
MVGALAMKERCSGIVLSMKIKFLQTVWWTFLRPSWLRYWVCETGIRGWVGGVKLAKIWGDAHVFTSASWQFDSSVFCPLPQLIFVSLQCQR